MSRWWFSCCLLLTMTDLAWSAVSQVEPLFRQIPPVGENRLPGSPTFGLQVLVGAETPPAPANVLPANSAVQTGYVSDVADKPAPVPIDPFGPDEEIEEPAFIEVETVNKNYEWQVLPKGVMYKSYLAGEKESRVRSVWFSDQNGKLIWETALGGRFSFLRCGTSDPVDPEGWEFDFEGAALPRVVPNEPSSPLYAVDFRIGLLSVWHYGKNRYKMGYYHLSSHVGDEFLLSNPGFVRLNYVRDSPIIGWTHDITREFQIYGEVAYAVNHEDGALPWEFQYGVQYSPRVPGLFGAPFGGINGHTRQDFNYTTSINVMAGWQWWSEQSNHTFRVGLQYYDGPSMQYEFVNTHERLMGWGLWFDY